MVTSVAPIYESPMHSAPSTTAEPISVVLASMQESLVAAFVGGALREAGIGVSHAATQEEALVKAAAMPGMTVVIVPRTVPGLAEAYATALRVNPRLRLLVVVTMKERADLLELRLLGRDVGYRGVVEAVRAAVATAVDPRSHGID